jgi:hypothetical protein
MPVFELLLTWILINVKLDRAVGISIFLEV